MYWTLAKIGNRYECHCSLDETKVMSLNALESAVGELSPNAAAWLFDRVYDFEVIHRATFVDIPGSVLKERNWRTLDSPISELK